MKKFSLWLKNGGNDCLIGLCNILAVLFGVACFIFLVRACVRVDEIIDLFIEKVSAMFYSMPVERALD